MPTAMTTPTPKTEGPPAETVFAPKGMAPTAEQRAIQLARKPHLIIEANAGAAKTTTLALRLAQALLRGADPQRVRVLTYTEAAVQAFADAMARIGLGADVRRHVRVQTFDAFCAERLLALEGTAVTRLDKPEQLRPHVLQAIERVLRNADERHPDEFTFDAQHEASVEGLLQAFSHLKGTMALRFEAHDRALTPALAAELGHDYAAIKIFHAFEHIRRGGHPDHPVFRAAHDATYDLARLLSDDDAWLGMGPQDAHPMDMGLHLVLVDEMHDTNRAMFTVLRELMAHNRAGFVGVGDRDQVIHALAGADARFMGETFDREVAVATRLPLSTTWRFGQSLADAVGRLARKPCVAQRPAGVMDTAVELIQLRDASEWRLQLRRLVTERVGLEAQAPLSGIAILLRQPHQSVALENLLLDHGIDHRTAGFLPYLQRPEVLFVRGLHACARDALGLIERPDTRAAVLRALLHFSGSRVDTGDLSPEQVNDLALRDTLEKQAIQAVCDTPSLAPSFLSNQVMRNAPPAVRHLLEDALDVIDSDDADTLQRRFVRVLQPQRLAARMMVRKQDIAQVVGNIEGLIQSASGFDHLTSFFRAMNEREVRQHGMPKKHALLISSIEAAKGLEFDHVILPHLNRGEFALGGHSVDNRNLLYVAMTRARRRLTVLCDADRPSAYLRDAGLL